MSSPTLLSIGIISLVIGSGCEPSFVPTGENYPPVATQHLIGKQMTHRTGRQFTNFTWVFDEDTFMIEGPDIPQDLSDMVLGPGLRTNCIKGTWSIQPTEMIRFETTSGQPPGAVRSTELPISFTGVIRIRTADAQYCFPAK